jgi:hypothetical protein
MPIDEFMPIDACNSRGDTALPDSLRNIIGICRATSLMLGVCAPMRKECKKAAQSQA